MAKKFEDAARINNQLMQQEHQERLRQHARSVMSSMRPKDSLYDTSATEKKIQDGPEEGNEPEPDFGVGESVLEGTESQGDV